MIPKEDEAPGTVKFRGPDHLVAGGRYARVCAPVTATLPVAGRVAAGGVA